MTAITIVDSSLTSENRSWTLDLQGETFTLRELIRLRIVREVSEYNTQFSENLLQHPERFSLLVQSTPEEVSLNGIRPGGLLFLHWDVQFEKAIQAFKRRGYVVLVNDKQVTDLDETVKVHAESSITFLKLVPLIGG